MGAHAPEHRPVPPGHTRVYRAVSEAEYRDILATGGVGEMVTKRAVVEWIPKERGGRSRPPSGVGRPPYSTVVRFVDDDEPWPPPVAWSLVVEKDEAQSEPARWIADVHFLVDEAPHDALRQGREFELYEGRKPVARGMILGESNWVVHRADEDQEIDPQMTQRDADRSGKL